MKPFHSQAPSLPHVVSTYIIIIKVHLVDHKIIFTQHSLCCALQQNTAALSQLIRSLSAGGLLCAFLKQAFPFIKRSLSA
jgi:hypothetical protein